MERELRRRQIRQKQERKKQVRMNRLLILTSIILIASLAVVYGQRKKISELKKSYNEQIDSQKRLKERVDALQAEIKQANTLEYIEKKAREELGMIKQNEKIYIEDSKEKASPKKEDKAN